MLQLCQNCPNVRLSCSPPILYSLLFSTVPPRDRQEPRNYLDKNKKNKMWPVTLITSFANLKLIRPLQSHSMTYMCWVNIISLH